VLAANHGDRATCLRIHRQAGLDECKYESARLPEAGPVPGLRRYVYTEVSSDATRRPLRRTRACSVT